MSLAYVVALSVALQLLAAILALTLMPLTERRLAWGLIALALFLMALRRVISLLILIVGSTAAAMDPLQEYVGLALSLFMLLGIALIRPIFTGRKQAEEELKESEARFRALAERSPLAIFVNRDEKVFLANPACLKLFGASSPKELIGKSVLELFDPDSQALVRERIRVDRKEVPLVEVRILRLDGTSVDVEATASPFLDQGVNAIQILLRDITERKQAEEELKESESRYRALAELMSQQYDLITKHANDVVLLSDEDLRIIQVNDAAIAVYGYTRDELLGMTIADLHQTSARGQTREEADLVKLEGSARFEAKHMRKDGSSIDVEVSVRAIESEGRTLYIGIERDITERKQADEALRQSEEKYAAAFHASPDSISITRLSDGVIVEVNEGFERMFGYTRAESIGKTTVELSVYADPGTRDSLVTRLRETGEVSDFDATLRRKDGTLLAAIGSARILDFQGEECFLAVTHDITERKQAEEALASSESRLKAMFEQAPMGIALVDSLTGRMDEVNPISARIAGRTIEEMCELDWMSITHPDDVQADLDNMALMNAGKTSGFQMEKRFVRPDGSTVWVSMTVAPVLVGDEAHPQHVAMVEDITANKEAEQLAARQTERIERTLTSVIDIAGDIGEMRDPYTAGHQKRVAELATRIAQDLGMPDREIADIRVAGLLHDMGKAGVPVEILGKPGAISPQEFALIQGHAEAGYRIAVSANMEEPIPELIYQHHERCDGSGYPRGLLCDQMLPGAKLLAVADVVEAMMSQRPYRPALGIEAAMAEIERGAGSLYDAEVSKACIALFRAGGFEFSS